MRMVNEETSFRLSSTQCIEQIHSQIKHFAELKMKLSEEPRSEIIATTELRRLRLVELIF